VDGSDGDPRDGMPAAQRMSRAARAEAAIHAIAAGADPGAEALNVSNRFTDDLTSRARGVFGRRKRRNDGAAESV
jgi:hypothetical protein